ncbi:hypothetical protein NC652_036656 [Populus alba x Populus x berolinensis]|nr:hypothetical protein NC652_036641 [Populus alba x Populus x berolinensis]KAJ6871051.1 hypothetical protein NC652_036656 [Populus alba x Populus x berolinensis]
MWRIKKKKAILEFLFAHTCAHDCIPNIECVGGPLQIMYRAMSSTAVSVQFWRDPVRITELTS